MERMDLKEEVCDFLRMLEFERGGYQALIKEFAEESEEEELNLDEKNFAILLEKYKAANAKCRIAVEEIVGFPIKYYELDFYNRELRYE